MTNAMINIRLGSFLEILDGNKVVGIYVQEYKDDGLEAFDRIDEKKVWALRDDGDFIKEYGRYKVVGINHLLNVTNILIEKA